MKSDQSWGFTAAPDFPRICRELAQTGCVVGLVTEAATKTLIGAPVVLTPEGKAQAAERIRSTIQDSLGDHYAVQVDLAGGLFGLTANVKVDEKPARPYAPGRMDRESGRGAKVASKGKAPSKPRAPRAPKAAPAPVDRVGEALALVLAMTDEERALFVAALEVAGRAG